MHERLIAVLTQVFGLRSDRIVPGLTKDDVGSWDSLKQMDLVVSLENEFEIVLEIEDIVEMTSVASIVNILINKGVDLGA